MITNERDRRNMKNSSLDTYSRVSQELLGFTLNLLNPRCDPTFIAPLINSLTGLIRATFQRGATALNAFALTTRFS